MCFVGASGSVRRVSSDPESWLATLEWLYQVKALQSVVMVGRVREVIRYQIRMLVLVRFEDCNRCLLLSRFDDGVFH